MDQNGEYKGLKIFCDLDGTVADIVTAWLHMYNNEFQENLKPDDVTKYDFKGVVPEERTEKMFSYLNSDGFFLKGIPINGSQQMLQALSDRGHDFICEVCGGRISNTDKLWYERGLDHGRKG